MKKYGFSLAELMITLMVIAIGAAITIPNLSKIIPNQDKLEIIKIYNQISKVTEQMLSNNELYFRLDPSVDQTTDNDFNPNGTFKKESQFGCTGLDCTSLPKESKYSANTEAYSGDRKYPNLLMEYLGLQNVTLYGATNNYSNQQQQQQQGQRLRGSGTFANGAKIEIIGSPQIIYYTIFVDLDPNNNKTCTYSNSCKHPDTYLIIVYNTGEVIPGDDLLKSYLKNISSTDSQADYEEAAQ